MVKLIRSYDFTSSEFFDYIEDSLTKEIKKARNNNKPIKIKAGTIYTLTGKDDTSTKVTINEFRRNELYSATFESMGEKLTVNYYTRDTPKGCTITLDETVHSYNPSQHNKLANFFYDFMYHRSAQEELNKLAKSIAEFKNK